jgi:hypothetical protein
MPAACVRQQSRSAQQDRFESHAWRRLLKAAATCRTLQAHAPTGAKAQLLHPSCSRRKLS